MFAEVNLNDSVLGLLFHIGVKPFWNVFLERWVEASAGCILHKRLAAHPLLSRLRSGQERRCRRIRQAAGWVLYFHSGRPLQSGLGDCVLRESGEAHLFCGGDEGFHELHAAAAD